MVEAVLIALLAGNSGAKGTVGCWYIGAIEQADNKITAAHVRGIDLYRLYRLDISLSFMCFVIVRVRGQFFIARVV